MAGEREGISTLRNKEHCFKITEWHRRLAADGKKNADAYGEIRVSLIMRDANKNGRKALKILRDYYPVKGKPRFINLYTTLTSIRKLKEETSTDDIIRAAADITPLHNTR